MSLLLNALNHVYTLNGIPRAPEGGAGGGTIGGGGDDGGGGGGEQQQQQNQYTPPDAATARAFLSEFGFGDLKDRKDEDVLGLHKGFSERLGKEKQGFPPNWRELMAGDDKAYLKTLARYNSPADFAKKTRSLESQLSSGEYVKKLPPNATPEQIAEHRKSLGLPEKPEGYLAPEVMKLPDGIVLGEDDKPFALGLAEVALAEGVPPAAFNKQVAKYVELREGLIAQQEEADIAYKAKSMDELREEFGPKFGTKGDPVIAGVNALLKTAPDGVADALLGGRLADENGKTGALIGNDPNVLRWLIQIAREIDPQATLVPPTEGDAGKDVDARMKEIESWMGAPKGTPEHAKYWKDEKVQAEWRTLSDARDKANARAGNRAA
jgi:hypothetical protein